ncbi:MAG: hypothetical protein HOM68_12950 [Gemmatimonadetes bacterium]|jgi:hypothetical protein|nr:hypothetical protein [Gemmatimonadota bacterium]MBT5057443.1 hypothetical protein [Gemmatimonadota bacterium]MBT5143588.1 hypothetical protein [Gemmatimonadota bacterium]MBT5588926.1 hypothetical protein [Gemmatimonadota bacterium]MBT5961372.1 hypothetical protein [Gemmatimonadota bacterium]
MFGRHNQPPKPPDHEPFLVVLLAVIIAGALTLGYGLIMVLIEGFRSQGMP